MNGRGDTKQQMALMTLEAAMTSARAGFACMFSTSDEYEGALISTRRAEGRYQRTVHWPVVAFIGCAMAMAVTVFVLA
jgi:hypothetical protein